VGFAVFVAAIAVGPRLFGSLHQVSHFMKVLSVYQSLLILLIESAPRNPPGMHMMQFPDTIV